MARQAVVVALGVAALLLAATGRVQAQFGIVVPQTAATADQPRPQEARRPADEAKRKADEAARKDEEARKKSEAAALEKAQDELRKARAGKATVVDFKTIKIGTHDAVAVTLERDEAQRVVLVPAFPDRQKHWVTDEELLAALRAIPSGTYEVVHTEERYGLEWVTGVGETSPKTLDDLARRRAAKTASGPSEAAAGDAEGAGSSESAEKGGAAKGKEKAKAEEPAVAVAVGRFVKLGEETVGGKAVKTVVIERGVRMEPATFYLAARSAKGVVTPAKKDMVQAAEKLAAGAAVRIEYVEVDGKFLVTSLKQTE